MLHTMLREAMRQVQSPERPAQLAVATRDTLRQFKPAITCPALTLIWLFHISDAPGFNQRGQNGFSVIRRSVVHDEHIIELGQRAFCDVANMILLAVGRDQRRDVCAIGKAFAHRATGCAAGW